MTYENLIQYEQQGNLGIVRLNASHTVNQTESDLAEALLTLQKEKLKGNKTLRAVAVLANGSSDAVIDLSVWKQTCEFWQNYRLPVVVGLSGNWTTAAVELLTAGDIRIVADSVTLSTPLEVKNASSMLQTGLADMIASAERLEAITLRDATGLSEMSPIMVQMNKKISNFIERQKNTF